MKLDTRKGHSKELMSFLGDNCEREVVCVIGLGFVGIAMMAALARAQTQESVPRYAIVGIDQDTEDGRKKVDDTGRGVVGFETGDPRIENALAEAYEEGRLFSTIDTSVVGCASVVVVDVNLDAVFDNSNVEPVTIRNPSYSVRTDAFLSLMSEIATNVHKGTLVLIESTIPPGFIEGAVKPIFLQICEERGWSVDDLRLAHSYERVMPGPNYLTSISEYYRVFSGVNLESRVLARQFLESFIDTVRFPLSELQNTTASETAKVLENSFRAMNIAFIQEWTELAELAKIDLFEILKAIRVRDSHRNIMSPGFGVGGYCLTKDGALADWGAKVYFGSRSDLRFSLSSIETNFKMPMYTLDIIDRNLETITPKYIVLFGVSYLPGVADTRSSPAYFFLDQARQRGHSVCLHDPIAKELPGREDKVSSSLEELPSKVNVAVFAVAHVEYESLDIPRFLQVLPELELVVDANNVLSEETRVQFEQAGMTVRGVGKGHWNKSAIL